MLKQVDFSILSRTSDEVISWEGLKEKLLTGKQLRIKYGVDVTAPFLHIGHAVNLWMMRYLQECGHKVVFLIGDFTTRIGDPTGKSKLRKIIPLEEIERNAEEFIRQVGTVLLTDPAVFEVRRNSEWYGKMPLSEFLSLASMVTHSRLIQRDMFQKRIKEEEEIYLHEMLYPLLQGYDSVELNSDLTIVGSDQLFNELMGRFYQERFAQAPQVIMTTKITPGTDGKEKQSKSLGNYIALADTPRDKFGKVMSLPDHLIVSYMQVYTMLPEAEIASCQEKMAQGLNPMEAKKLLAQAIVERYHGKEAAQQELEWFVQAFSKRETPEDLPVVQVEAGMSLLSLLQICLPKESKSALRRLVEGGGVRLDGEKLSSMDEPLQYKEGSILKVGKKSWFQLHI